MALLSRLASSTSGAELLLESGLMLRLAEMRVFSMRPESVNDNVELIPNAFNRYHQILMPALRLCQAVLASMGASNKSASSQVFHFIQSNEELVNTLLKSRGVRSLSHLQQVRQGTK